MDSPASETPPPDDTDEGGEEEPSESDATVSDDDDAAEEKSEGDDPDESDDDAADEEALKAEEPDESADESEEKSESEEPDESGGEKPEGDESDESESDEPEDEDETAEPATPVESSGREPGAKPNWPVIALIVAGLLVVGAVVWGFLAFDGGDGETSSSPPSTDGTTASAPEEYCAAVEDLNDANAALANDPEAAGEGDAVVKALKEPLARIAATAPPEIREQAETLEAEFSTRFEVLASVDFDASKLSPEQLEELNDPAFQEAGSAVAEYTLAACGIPLGGGAPQGQPPQGPPPQAPQGPQAPPAQPGA